MAYISPTLYLSTQRFYLGSDEGDLKRGAYIEIGDYLWFDGTIVEIVSTGQKFPTRSLDNLVLNGTLVPQGTSSGDIPNQRTISVDDTIVLTDDQLIVDTSAGNVTVTLPLLASTPNGRAFEILCRGANRCYVAPDALDPNTIDNVAVDHVLQEGGRIRIAKVFQIGGAAATYWGIFARAGGVDAQSHIMLAPHVTANERLSNRGRLTVGDAVAAGFTQAANVRGIQVAGSDDSTRGLRIGNNGDVGSNLDEDFIFRAFTGNFGTGTLELLYNNNNATEGRLALIGLSGSRIHLSVMDGSVIVGAENDPAPYNPPVSIGLEVRNALVPARSFAVAKTGEIQTNQGVAPAGAVPGADANNALVIHDTTGAVIGYIPIHTALW